MNEKTILTIYNNHSANCGEPPRLDNTDRSKYYGYFQNEYGEQWLFEYDHETGTGTLRGSDAGWEQNYEVVDGHAPGLILNASERKWLAACWDAAAPQRPKPEA